METSSMGSLGSIDGFLPFSRASLMLDVVASAMFVVVPTVLWGVYLVRYRKKYDLHRRVMLGLSSVLVLVIVLFEIDVRINGWRQFAEVSPYYDTWLNKVLAVHLVFAISTTILWTVAVVGAVRHFKPPVRPNEYSPIHKRIARLAAIDICLTAVTGVTFHWMAFIA